MKNKHKPLLKVVSAAVLSMMATSVAFSAGFALYGEGNGAATGNYGAGLAAEAADASIGWFNPAGLVLIGEQQLVIGAVGVLPRSSISGTSTFTTFDPPIPPYIQSFSKLTSAENAVVPSLHYALPLGDSVTFGLSLVSPFGLSTDWDPKSPIRYEATHTELLSGILSPELGVRVTDSFSIGAGLDLQYAQVQFNQVVGAPTALQLAGLNPTLDDTTSFNKGTSNGVGFHAGIMGMFNDNHTRVGLNYQSRIRHTFHGFSRLTGPLATNDSLAPEKPPGVFMSHDLYSNPIYLPDVVTLSGYQDVNKRFALLGSVIYTGWGVFRTIQLNNVAGPIVDPSTAVEQGFLNITSPQNYKDVWRIAVGANYYINNQWMLRVGGGYDETPTNDVDRDVRLPDSDRWALAFGARYLMRANLSFDAGYTHLFGISNNGINRTDPLGDSSSYNVTASATSSADLIGVQLNWTIDKVEEAPMK